MFVSEDGKSTYSGITDASGVFSLTSGTSSAGVPAGTYKVTVTKVPNLGGGEMKPDSPEYLAQMEKERKEIEKGEAQK